MSDVNATKYELCWLDSACVMLDQSKYMPRQSKAHTSRRLRALYQLRQRRASELLREQELSPRPVHQRHAPNQWKVVRTLIVAFLFFVSTLS